MKYIMLVSLVMITACGEVDDPCELPYCSEVDVTGQECSYPVYSGNGYYHYARGGRYTCNQDIRTENYECRCKKAS